MFDMVHYTSLYLVSIFLRMYWTSEYDWYGQRFPVLDPCTVVYRPEKITYFLALDAVAGIFSIVISANLLLYFRLNYLITCET